MTKYTPDTGEVREQYWAATGEPRRGSEAWAEFDRWFRKVQAEAKSAGVREIAEQFERQAEIGPLYESQLTEEQRDWWTRNTPDGMLYGDDEEAAAIWLRNRADRIEREETE